MRRRALAQTLAEGLPERCAVPRFGRAAVETAVERAHFVAAGCEAIGVSTEGSHRVSATVDSVMPAMATVRLSVMATGTMAMAATNWVPAISQERAMRRRPVVARR